jgi:hypothetical protein
VFAYYDAAWSEQIIPSYTAALSSARMSYMADQKELPDLSTLDGFVRALQYKEPGGFFRSVGTLHSPHVGQVNLAR